MRSLLGGNCAVTAYLDAAEQNKVHIFTSANAEGVVAATVGLMEVDQSRNPAVRIPTEIIMDQRGHDPRIANILSSIAFQVMKDGWKVAPGVVFERMVEMYIPDTGLPHVMFTAPFQWEGMSKVRLADRAIYPLVAVPVSEAESRVAASNAGRDLESLWTRQSVDVLDWGRQSAV